MLNLGNKTLDFALHFSTEILEPFESKSLLMIVETPWYEQNQLSERNLRHEQLKKKSVNTDLSRVLA
jgi:hypothetical protein